MKNPEKEFAALVATLRDHPGVTVPSTEEEGTHRKFGSNGLRMNGKVFAMLSTEKRLIVKLPRTRVDDFVASRDGARFDPRRNGQLMKEWLVVDPSSKISWTELAREAMRFVGSSSMHR